MPLSHPHRATGRAVARLGVVVALTVGVCGACTAADDAAPPLAPPAPLPGPPVPAAGPAEPWASLVRCETDGDWHADTGNGRQGGLQLSSQTWRTYGGGQFAPRADQASPEHQIVVGDRIRVDQGWEAWSGCSEELGLI